MKNFTVVQFNVVNFEYTPRTKACFNLKFLLITSYLVTDHKKKGWETHKLLLTLLLTIDFLIIYLFIYLKVSFRATLYFTVHNKPKLEYGLILVEFGFRIYKALIHWSLLFKMLWWTKVISLFALFCHQFILNVNHNHFVLFLSFGMEGTFSSYSLHD